MFNLRLMSMIMMLIFAILFSCCAKKIISAEKKGLVKPIIKKDMKLQIAYFINQSKKSELNILEEAIPRFLLEDLAHVNKIHLASKHAVITNKKEVLKAKKYFDQLKLEEMKEITQDVRDDSNKILGKPISNMSVQQNNQNNHLQQNLQYLYEKNTELDSLLEYLQFYEKEHPAFKAFFGIDVNRSILNIIGIYDLQVLPTLIRLQTKKVFQLNNIYQQLSKSSADLTLVGTIKTDGKGVNIQVKLYNKYLNQFIFSKTFSFSEKDLSSLNIDKKVKSISNQLVAILTDFPKGKLIITTKPKGAYVFLDGKSIGHSNLKKKVIYGYHTIEILKKGYHKLSGEIYIEKNKSQKLVLNLDKLKGFGSITVVSTPDGADVYVDLDYHGKTPIDINKLKPGIYKIRLEKKGYKHSYLIVNVKPNKKITVTFKMIEGESTYEDVADLSKTYNTFKNIFFYSSFVSLSAMLYAYLRIDKYYDKYVGEQSSASPNANKLSEYRSKYNSARRLRNITVGTTIGLVVLTAIFQLLELNTEDIEVGFTPKTPDPKEKHKNEDEVGANFQIKIKF